MKKALSVLAVLAVIFMAGCENQKPNQASPPPVPESFSTNLEVAYSGTTMTARFEKKSADEFEVKMLSPEIMTPLSLVYKSGICTVTYDGLKFETDLSRFPQAAFGALLTQALEDIENEIDIQKTYADGVWTYTGTGERGVFVLTRNAETGAWIELSVEGAALHIVFSDFKTEK